MRKKFVIAALITVAAAYPLVGAQMAASQIAPAAMAPMPAGWLGAGEIASRLAAAGWTVLKLEAEPSDANYKACVVGTGGPQIEARIDPLTGTIVSQEAKDCLGGGGAPMTLDALGGHGSSDDSDDSNDSSDDSGSSSDSDDPSDDSRSN